MHHHHPRRPYYNYRTEDMPQDTNTQHVSVIDSKRFWKLLKQLTRRKEEARAAKAKDTAATG